MRVLVIAEHNHHTLNENTLRTVHAASQLGSADILVAGYQCGAVAETASRIENIHKVLLADHEVYQHFLAENLSKLIAELARDYTHLLAPASTFGKNLMPRVAALLDVAQISDLIEIKSADIFVRPVYAGNALAEVKSHDAVKVLTLRTSAFNVASVTEHQAPIEKLEKVIENSQACFVEQSINPSERPDLTSARVVISGGRGLQNAENFKLLESLADRLHAALGASRAAVDAGFVPNDYQVGQTGKIVAPELYIAVGISGAIQHLAGMKESKVIVAINKDEDAPIFKVADYGLVGDLFQIIPELNQALDKLMHQ